MNNDHEEDREDEAKAPGRRSGEGSGSVFEHMMRDQQVKNGGIRPPTTSDGVDPPATSQRADQPAV